MGDVRRLPDDDRDGRLTLGMAFFLASWGMMFGGLLVAYGILRADAPEWPPDGAPRLPLGLPVLATGILATSSVTMERAVRSVRSARLAGLRSGLVLTIVLGAVFLALQSAAWSELWSRGLRAEGRYGGTFYVITWFHAAHVVVGLGLLFWLLAGASRGRWTTRSLAPVRLTAMFWHFLGASWAVIFLGVYLV